MIYLDYAATTPMSATALEVYEQVARSFYGNPNSLHDIGSTALTLLEKARVELAELIGCEAEGVYFTSSGSDANITALQSMIKAHKQKGNHIITSQIEHSSINNLFKKLELEGFEITYVPVNEFGLIDPEDVKNAINDRTILASIHHANGEIGVVQQINAIGEILAKQSVLFHCDAVQALGKIPIDIRAAQIDSLSISSHKVYGPKGVGMAYMNPMMKWSPQIPGTSHEGGFRPGTVDVPGILSFATSTKMVCNDLIEENERIRGLRATLLQRFKELKLPIEMEGMIENNLPHVLGLRVLGIEGQYVMLECNRRGIAISTGSACQVGNQEPSRMMMALGKSEAEAKQFIRLSFGKYTTKEDIDKTADVFHELVDQY